MKHLTLKRAFSALLALIMMISLVVPTLGTSAYAANNHYEIQIGETVAMPKTEGNATWSTSNSSVASVSNDGVVTGVGEGTATITVTIKEEAAPGASYGWFGYWFHWFFSWTKTTQHSYTVTVVKPVQPEEPGTSFELKVGETLALPKTANGAQWSSSDNQIATVSNDGVVTGVKAGTVTVTETVRTGGNWFANFFWFFPWWNTTTSTNEYTITVVNADEPEPPEPTEEPAPDSDQDRDGVEFEIEELFGTSSTLEDSDGDGLSDYVEIYSSRTEPTMADTDDNGVSDADEDCDQDGLSNIEEVSYGTAVEHADTDQDGLSDYDEIRVYHTDPLQADTDGDGMYDGDEIIFKLDPLFEKTDGSTPDNERLFEQELLVDNIDGGLLADGNDAIPSLNVVACGNINRTSYIDQSANIGFSDSRSLVGKPISLISDGFDSAKLSFVLSETVNPYISVQDGSNPDSTQKICSLLICRYNEDESVTYFESSYDPNTNVITADIDQPGVYYVLDVQALFDELGYSMPSVTNPLILEDDATAEVLSVASEFNQNQRSDASSSDKKSFAFEAASADKEKAVLFAADSPDAMAQADIVFVIDTTGSMSSYISNAKNNMSYFVDALKERGISAALALVEYRDIDADGYDSTIVHKNGTSNWFYNIESYKSAIAGLSANGGGDTPESVVDALETARLLDMRASAGKIFILITDADYKVENRYGIPSMASEIELLKNAEVSCSVVSHSSYQSTYSDLYLGTGGIFANLNGNFYNELMALADRIGTEIVGDGCWIYLQGPVPVPVRLDQKPEAGSSVDTDHDGISDVDELGSAEPTGIVDLDQIITKMSRGAITNTSYGKVYVYRYASSPVEQDTDFDGIADQDDKDPKSNLFSGRISCSDYGSDKGHIAFNVDYRNFFQNPSVFNKSIGVLSSIYATDIYTGKTVLVNDLLSSRESRSELLSAFGLKDAHVYEVGYEDFDRTEIAVGHHLVEYRGEKREVVLVSIRGTNGTFAEWSSNFDLGADTSNYYNYVGSTPEWTNKENHKGFDVTANRVMKRVELYLNDPNTHLDPSAKIVYWVTGHSRGAGIANLVGHAYESMGKTAYTYTFASPLATTSADSCSTVFNIVNGDDLIPMLPLSDWGFRRYGTDIIIKLSDYSSVNILGTYWSSSFKDMVGINYNNNEKIDWLLEKFSNVCSNRNEVYVQTYADNTLQYYGINYTDQSKASEHLNEVLQGMIKDGAERMTLFGDFVVLEATDLLGRTVYVAGCYQTPAFFMQALAELASTHHIHMLADRYVGSRNAFAVTYASGMAHPHWQEAYYLLASGASSSW